MYPTLGLDAKASVYLEEKFPTRALQYDPNTNTFMLSYYFCGESVTQKGTKKTLYALFVTKRKSKAATQKREVDLHTNVLVSFCLTRRGHSSKKCEMKYGHDHRHYFPLVPFSPTVHNIFAAAVAPII